MTKGTTTRINRSRAGFASILLVVFSTLTVTVVVIGFVTLMIRNQQDAAVAERSQTAYDAALAGVEDAKRALVKAQDDTAVDDLLSSGNCDSVNRALYGRSGEVSINQTEGAAAEGSSYTCVTVDRSLPQVTGTLGADDFVTVIPLKTATPFSKVRITWGRTIDQYGNGPTPSFAGPLNNLQFPSQDTWDDGTPALLRAQIVKYGSAYQMSNFDDHTSASATGTMTRFLYPLQGVGSASGSWGDLPGPTAVSCSAPSNHYACGYALDLGRSEGRGTGSQAYLVLGAHYSRADYTVSVLDSSGNTVPLVGVQAIVDSNGRENDTERRVRAVVNLAIQSNLRAPDAGLDVGHNLCKVFVVTDSSADLNQDKCDPAAT